MPHSSLKSGKPSARSSPLKYVETEQAIPTKPLLFADIPEDELLRYGVPAEWLEDVRAVNEDGVLDLADHLPSEAAEALLDLATGVTPQIVQATPGSTDPFDHPDAQRRFRLMQNVEELERALESPGRNGPFFCIPPSNSWLSGTITDQPGFQVRQAREKPSWHSTGRFFLARNHPDARVLLTTFSDTLANALKLKLKRLIINTPHIGEQLEVHAMNAIGLRLYKLNYGLPKIASREEIQILLEEAAKEINAQKFTLHFSFPNGSRSLTHGSLKTGKPIVMSCGWVEKRAFRSSIVACSGPSSNRSGQN